MKKLLYTLIIILFAVSGFAATYTVCSSGCDETAIQDVFDNNDLAPGDIVEVRADAVGGTKEIYLPVWNEGVWRYIF